MCNYAGGLKQRLILAMVVVGSGGVAIAQEPATQEPAAPQPAAPGAVAPRFVRGQLAARYRLRRTGADADQDIYSTLQLDVGDAERDPVTGYFFGTLAGDLDGHGTPAFAGVDDRYDDPYARVYDAYADIHRVPGMANVRVGRQRLIDTPEVVWFDGLWLETQPQGGCELQFGAYGGVATHVYESSPAGDVAAGVYASFRPWHEGRLRCDWMHLRDDARLASHDDDLLGVSLWQGLGRSLSAELGYTRLEGRDRDLDARCTWVGTDWGTSVWATYHELMRTQRSLVVELDPFFTALHEEFPFRQMGLHVSQALCPLADLQLATEQRHVADRGDVGPFNRDFERYQASLTVRDLWAKGASATGTLDRWWSNAQEVVTWGAELQQRCGETFTVSVGSYYSLYQFDLFTDSERDHVRTWYGRLRYRVAKATTIEASGALEDSDLDRHQTLRLGVTWQF